METIRYLAYGSNLLPARIGARLDSFVTLGTTALPGWRLCFHKMGADGSGKCNLIVDPRGRAYGAVYELSLGDKTHLDAIEGVGKGYSDKSIELDAFGPAWVYLAEPSHIDDQLIPYDWYHSFVLYGARHHRFPADYIHEITDVACVPDQDLNRRTENLAILNSRNLGLSNAGE
ncbi:MAG: gamma-glutamylcyclotransferase [Gammaproteobacteria bacterium]|jgi:gamma-glutamylcyclotransferase